MNELPDIQCDACDGEGVIWNNNDASSGQGVQCEECKGEGWREATQDELNDMAADAYSDMCESEPPLSMDERRLMDWHQKQELNR